MGNELKINIIGESMSGKTTIWSSSSNGSATD